MTVPSKNWTNIADTQVDADSPLDATLITAIRDDLVHIKEWLGYGFTAAQAHNHDNVNSASVVLADAIVSVAKLKLTQGSWQGNVTAGTPAVISMTRYGHTPVVGVNNTTPVWAVDTVGSAAASSAFKVTGTCPSGTSTGHITWDYHAA